MKQLFAPLILISFLATMATHAAHAATGLATLPATSSNGPVTVFYPAAGADTLVQRGPFSFQALLEAAPLRGNGRLIVISHGSGGAPWVYTELAQRLVAAGYIVALPEHSGDNWQDKSKIGPPSFQLRPLEVSAAIDAVQADPRFAPLADFKQVGLWGMSAGGHTALSLAGGRWSAGQLRRHCEEHLAEATNACTVGAIELNGGPFDGFKKTVALTVIRHKLSDDTWHSHTDPRIQAIVAGVPFSADFDMASLARPVVPLGLVQAQGDVWLLPKFNSGAVLQACKNAKNCELVADMPTAGHGALLAPLPPGLDGWLGRMMSDPPGFDRARDLPPMYDNTLAFFKKHLLP